MKDEYNMNDTQVEQIASGTGMTLDSPGWGETEDGFFAWTTEDDEWVESSKTPILTEHKARQAERTKKMLSGIRLKDPYWSLWGKIKAQHRRFTEEHEAIDDLYDEGQDKLADLVAGELCEESRSRPLLVLPLRQIEVGGNAEELRWSTPDGNSHRKKVTSDHHAVATLRKLDTNDEYFNGATS